MDCVTYIHTYIHTYTHVHKKYVYIYIKIYRYIHTYIHTYVHTYIHGCLDIDMYTQMHRNTSKMVQVDRRKQSSIYGGSMWRWQQQQQRITNEG